MGEVGLLLGLRGVKPHPLCAANRVPAVSYELTPANVAEVSMAEELLAEAKLGAKWPAGCSGT